MLIYSPPYTPNSMYRPNLFVTMQSSANPLVLAIASVVVDLATVTSIRKSPSYVLGGTNYYFEFDVAKILQTNSAPNPTQKQLLSIIQIMPVIMS